MSEVNRTAYKHGKTAYNDGEALEQCKAKFYAVNTPKVAHKLFADFTRGYNDEKDGKWCPVCFGEGTYTEHYYPGGSMAYRCECTYSDK